MADVYIFIAIDLRKRGLMDVFVGPQEFCQLETFRSTCLKAESVAITSAAFGRMRPGKCIPAKDSLNEDPKFLGCSTDVLPFADVRCSGKKDCEIRIPDSELQLLNPCHDYLKAHLEISYTCLLGINCIFSIYVRMI